MLAQKSAHQNQRLEHPGGVEPTMLHSTCHVAKQVKEQRKEGEGEGEGEGEEGSGRGRAGREWMDLIGHAGPKEGGASSFASWHGGEEVRDPLLQLV